MTKLTEQIDEGAGLVFNEAAETICNLFEYVAARRWLEILLLVLISTFCVTQWMLFYAWKEMHQMSNQLTQESLDRLIAHYSGK
jgi:hypothetical protein